MEEDEFLALAEREQKLELAKGPDTSAEILSNLARDHDEEIRLFVALNDSSPRKALYSELDFDGIRVKVSELRDWLEIYGEIDEIDESDLSKYSNLQIWSENNDEEYEVRLESGEYEGANRLFVSRNLRADEDEVSIVTAVFIQCPFPIEFDEFDYDGRPNCCGGGNNVYIDLEDLVNDDSDESILACIEWADLN